MRLSCFVQSIWKSAICNQSNEFPLEDHVKYLAVSVENWYNMPHDSQESYIREYRNMNKFEIESKKLITVPATTNEVPLAIETLWI